MTNHQQQHRGYSNPTQLQQQTAGQSGIKGNGSGGYPGPPHPLSDQWQASSNTSKESSNATRRRRVNSPYVVEDSDV